MKISCSDGYYTVRLMHSLPAIMIYILLYSQENKNFENFDIKVGNLKLKIPTLNLGFYIEKKNNNSVALITRFRSICNIDLFKKNNI